MIAHPVLHPLFKLKSDQSHQPSNTHHPGPQPPVTTQPCRSAIIIPISTRLGRARTSLGSIIRPRNNRPVLRTARPLLRFKQDINLSRAITRHPQSLVRIKRHADRAEALIRTDAIIFVHDDVLQRIAALLSADGGFASVGIEGDGRQAVADGVGLVEGSAEGDERGIALGRELDVDGRVVSGESEAGCDVVRSASFVCEFVARDGLGVFLGDGELRADLEVVVLWNLRNVPDRETLGVAVVATLVGRLGAVEIPKEVELLARVVLVDIFAVAGNAIDGVLDRVDAAGDGVLAYADRVAQAPAEHDAVFVVVVGLGGAGHVGDVEGADLRETVVEDLGLGLVAVGAAARDEEVAVFLLRE